ncbi:hypothetical protein ACLOJK_000396 [Asimina triloba]
MAEFLCPTTARSVLLLLHVAAAFALLLPHFVVVTARIHGHAPARGAVGVNYGMLGDNLPAPDAVVGLLRSRHVRSVRLFDPNPTALKALEGSGIDVALGTRNEDLPRLAADPAFAASWVATNVLPHAPALHFRCVSAGNEVIPGDLAPNVLPAIQNLAAALRAANLSVPVTTAVSMQVLGASYPPSQGSFSAESAPFMAPIAAYLQANGAPLLVNVYPYFPYAASPANIRLDYALFTAEQPVVIDGPLRYFNLFDAMVDAAYWALEKAGGPSVEIVVSESGWPSAGNGEIATVGNARTYNNNLLQHLSKGTPKRPKKDIEAFVFAIFNEDLKAAGIEQNFGLFYPNMTEVYHVDFPLSINN